MPAPVVSSSPANAAGSSTIHKARLTTKAKKLRAVRRRGRARGGIESDDEIERVLSSDSDYESDESLSTDSATDSEQESASEDELPDQQINPHTPNTSHSSGRLDNEGVVNEKSTGTFFSSTGNWSEMVAEENADGAADLPVIEFSDFKADLTPLPRMPTKKANRGGKKKASAMNPTPPSHSKPSELGPTDEINGDDSKAASEDGQGDASPSQYPLSHPKRPLGQSARQVYQQKLESDPSFVPKVGGFWGHDDRLMDKDLRSLSGWWRGRWQGRGRGIGITSGIGRRGPHAKTLNKDDVVDLPPIELPWTHDGFEEMKRKEEQRSEVQRQANVSSHGIARGRAGTLAARGGRGGHLRGAFTNPGMRATAAARAGRVWYAMKPELMWTKQSENFLFFESSKHRSSSSTYRIQLPDSRTQSVRSPLSNQHSGIELPSHTTAATASIAGSEVGDLPVTIKLPKREEEPSSGVVANELEDVFKVRPHLVNVEPIPLPVPLNTKSSPTSDQPTHHHSSSSAATPDSAARSQLEQLSLDHSSTDPTRLAQTEKAVLRNPVGETPVVENRQKSPSSGAAPRRPSLPPIETVYSPPAQSSPVYHPSYLYPALPPGIALNQHGVPYEMATGRPVFIPSSNPPPMYNPRPIVHSQLPQHNLSYIPPPHVLPSSTLSPDFSAHQSSHSHTPSIGVPVNGFIDPATGVPMFSLPRSSRVEIRAPGETSRKTVANGGTKLLASSSPNSRESSHLRATATPYTTSPSHPGADYTYNAYSSSSDVSALPTYASLPEAGVLSEPGSNATPQAMVHYPAYQQYYYPDPSYGYSHYMDVSQIGQYEMYPPMEHQGTSYY